MVVCGHVYALNSEFSTFGKKTVLNGLILLVKVERDYKSCRARVFLEIHTLTPLSRKKKTDGSLHN